jgi:hypothetical protein
MPNTQPDTGKNLRSINFAASYQPPDADVLAPLPIYTLREDLGNPAGVPIQEWSQHCSSVGTQVCSCHFDPYCPFRRLQSFPLFDLWMSFIVCFRPQSPFCLVLLCVLDFIIINLHARNHTLTKFWVFVISSFRVRTQIIVGSLVDAHSD